MTTRFQLFTCNYPAFRDQMGTPVRTSNGTPRFALKYDLVHTVREVFPSWKLVKSNAGQDAFRRQYQEGLDDVGVDVFASRFRAISVAEDEPRLVLLCFEDISKPDWWCHRTMFAEWWTRETGDEVRELGPKPDPPLVGLF